MLTQEDDVDIHALRKRGWSISAIARHVGRDRKTVRAYLTGKRQVGKRAPAGQDSFARFAEYCSARLVEDPHLWATALHDEVVKLGYQRSYPAFTRALRLRGLRPACEPCHPTKGRPAAIIEHPPGEETQWDWVELPDPPTGWDGYGKRAFCWWGRCLARRSGERCCVSRWISRNWPTPNTRSRSSSAASPGIGGSTGWPPWCTPGPGRSPPPTRRSPSTSGPGPAMPAASRQPQRRRGEGESRGGATLVAQLAR